MFLIKITKATPGDAISIANLLHESGKFAYAEPNLFVSDVLLSNDPLYNKQWALENTGSATSSGNTYSWSGTFDADIDADSAWLEATGVVIAIMDNGVDLNHEDLGPLFPAANYRMLPGKDFTSDGNPNGAAVGNFAHGTQTAGVAAATMDNNLGGTGVAPGAKILPIRTAIGNNHTWAAIAQGFKYATCNGADKYGDKFSLTFV